MVSMTTVIRIILMVLGTSTASISRKRFIYNTNTNQGSPYGQTSPYNQPMSTAQFCSFCPIRCNNGYVTSSTGCLLCRCKTTTSSGGFLMSSSGSSYQSNPVYLSNPCVPHIRYCNVRCPNGLLLGANGCQYCACAVTRTTVPPAPVKVTAGTRAPYIKPTLSSITVNLQPHEIFLSNPCSPHIRYCPIKCVHGLKLGQNGCQLCACAKNTTSTVLPPQTTIKYSVLTSTSVARVTTAPLTIATTVAQTLPPYQKNPDFFDPCIPSQTTCNKDCGGNYVKGPQGCQYCICMSRIPESLRAVTTAAPFGPYRPVNDTQDHHVMTEACLVAKAICQLNCPNGFQSAPDCLYCKCITQTQADDPSEDPGFKVKLPNPCIQGLDQCELLCTSGYLLGPRECQFCTCRV